jgi:2-succinyl-6-hydroxy-2,4-cyclohexadiene-1-carboxylate synthase
MRWSHRASWKDHAVDTEHWAFVDGFTQTGRVWPSITSGAVRAGKHSGSGAPVAATFVDAAHHLGWLTTYLEIEHRLERTTYVGYSQGGRLCLQLALDRPEVVHRLGLVSASPGIADPVERAARRDADERLAQEIERDGVDAFLERWLAQPLFATLPPERAGVAERSAHNTVERLTYQLRVLGQGAQPSNWDRLPELRMPVLLIVGGLDTKYVDIAHRMAADIPHARVEVIAGAGHACHLEQPEVIAQLLASW